jgi:hypothetical protein
MNQPKQSADDLLDTVIRGSVGGRFATAACAGVAAAWASSASRRLISSTVDGWSALSPVERVRTLALAGATAMLVHLAMSRLGAAEPLGAVVPVLVIAACGVLALCAGAVARTWERLYP